MRACASTGSVSAPMPAPRQKACSPGVLSWADGEGAVVGVAGGLLVVLGESLDEDVRQDAGLHVAEAAIEVPVQFPVAHGLAARASLETRGQVGGVESAQKIDEGRIHGLHHRIVVSPRVRERFAQPVNRIESPAVVRLEQFLDQLIHAVPVEGRFEIGRLFLVGHAHLVALVLLCPIAFLETEQRLAQ